MPLYRDEAVVLRTAKLGEADRIITLFTRDHGKIRSVAKGVRRTKSRFGARLEPFMRVDLLIAEGRSLDVVSQAETLAAYGASIASDYASYEAASVVVETIDKLVSTEHEPVPGQYRLLIGALNALAKHAHQPRSIASSYVMRALAIAGWQPRLHACVVCGRIFKAADPIYAGPDRVAPQVGNQCRQEPLPGDIYLSAASGGAMCEADHTSDARRLSPVAVCQIAALMRGDWTVLDTDSLEPAAEQFVEDWGEYYLERPLRSLRLIESQG